MRYLDHSSEEDIRDHNVKASKLMLIVVVRIIVDLLLPLYFRIKGGTNPFVRVLGNLVAEFFGLSDPTGFESGCFDDSGECYCGQDDNDS